MDGDTVVDKYKLKNVKEVINTEPNTKKSNKLSLKHNKAKLKVKSKSKTNDTKSSINDVADKPKAKQFIKNQLGIDNTSTIRFIIALSALGLFLLAVIVFMEIKRRKKGN